MFGNASLKKVAGRIIENLCFVLFKQSTGFLGLGSRGTDTNQRTNKLEIFKDFVVDAGHILL